MKGLLCIALFASFALSAHDTYLMPAKFTVKPGKPLFVSVHTGDSFPVSEHPTAPDRLITSLTDLRIAGRATHGIAEVTKAGSMYVTAQTKPKLSVLAAEKFEAYLTEEGLHQIVLERKEKRQSGMPGRELYSKYAKALLTVDVPDAGFLKPSGLPIEIVPQADPTTLAPGSTLQALVLWNGKPAPGIQVERAWAHGGKSDRKVIGRTDARGRIDIPVDSPGRWRLHAVHMRASTQPGADWESHWASLTFEVPPAVFTQR
jgi:uncharacterized GH25 family protein